MSTAPKRCLYCNGTDPNCGFCDDGKPLDTQEDWDKSWGRIIAHTGRPSHDPLTCQDGHLGCELARDERLGRS